MDGIDKRICGMAAAIALCAGPAVADSICFNAIGAPALPGPPPVPGDPADPHWSTVFRFDYHNGTPIADGTMLAGSSGAFLYLQWTVNNVTGFNNSDSVVMAFKDASLNQYDLFVIRPNCDGVGVTQKCDANGPACGAPTACATPNDQPSQQPSFFTGTFDGTNWNWTPATLPAGVVFGAKGDINTANWTVQMKMPFSVAGSYSVPTNFAFYSDVFRVDSNTGTVTELTWPNNAGNLIVTNARNLPPPAQWGNATRGNGPCVGLHLTRLYTNGTLNGAPDPLLINFDRSDMRLMADYSNTGTTNATCVSTMFRIANFGIANNWKQVPSANNPTPAQTVPGLSSGTFTAGPWNVPADPDVNSYKPGANPHQCIRADLSVVTSGCTPSGSGNTFDVASFFQNMDFGHSSVFTREPAEIRGDIAAPPAGKTTNRYDLRAIQTANLTETGARLTIAVHGVRHLGKTVKLPTGRFLSGPPSTFATRGIPELIEYEVVERLPSFGYVIDHALAASERASFQKSFANASSTDLVKAWNLQLQGLPEQKTVKPTPGVSFYTLDIAPTEVVKTTPRVEFVGTGGGSSASR
jgi:hypothetical protein